MRHARMSRPRGRTSSSPPARTSVRRSWLVAAIALAACKKGGGEAAGEDELPPAAVTCTPVTAGTIEEIVSITGVIAPPPKVDAIVSSPVVGRVAQVTIEEGDHVAAGQLLAIVEDPSLPAGSIEARAG